MGDVCAEGACQPGAPRDCSDGNVCTGDGCLPASGCEHPAQDGPCDDGDGCTLGDECAGGVCQAGPFPLDCDDDDVCTGVEVCDAGACQAGSALTCVDDDACTDDTCDADDGCVFVPLTPCCGNGVTEPGETCDDGGTDAGDGCNETCQSEIPDVCVGYIELDDATRHVSFNDGKGGVGLCDDSLPEAWYRFVGDAGVALATSPPGIYACGTDAAGWMTEPLPAPGEGIVDRSVCFQFLQPCEWEVPIRAAHCGSYWVFELGPTPSCKLRFCGADVD